jgi:hypothetical protein
MNAYRHIYFEVIKQKPFLTAIQKKETQFWTAFPCGGSCRNRTYNPLIKSQLLCQLS